MIEKIVQNGFCIGCGLCSSIIGKDKCEMKLYPNGFYYPKIKGGDTKDKIVKDICPGIRVTDHQEHGVWGHVDMVAEAWSTDKDLRYRAASGGASSAIILYLLENNKVDAVLQVGVVDGDFLQNELKVSRTRKEIFNNAQSRYAPALTLYNLKQILDIGKETYAFVGKPCDIAGIKNFIEQYPVYKERIKYTISIFCAGMPSYNASKKTWQKSGNLEDPVSLKYRGDGWPGNFKAVWKNGESYEISYNESWGKVLGKHLCFRCKICPDGIGLLADISVGDSWNTLNGYPNFKEADGRNFCFIRTQNGVDIFNDAVQCGYLESRAFHVSNVQNMQRYQYARRHLVGWRIMASYILSMGQIKFRGLGLNVLALKSNKVKGLKEFIGTWKRFVKNKNIMRFQYE